MVVQQVQNPLETDVCSSELCLGMSSATCSGTHCAICAQHRKQVSASERIAKLPWMGAAHKVYTRKPVVPAAMTHEA